MKIMIQLKMSQFGCYELLNLDTNKSKLIQTDWDFPGIASSFGFIPCECCRIFGSDSTDGTVDCIHKKTSQMIKEARDFLDDHCGDKIEDPGYFEVPEGFKI